MEPRYHKIHDQVNDIIFYIKMLDKPANQEPIIATNLIGVWLGGNIPESKKEVISLWDTPQTVWYHSDFVEDISAWQNDKRLEHTTFCDLKKIEKYMDPKLVALAHYLMKGPHLLHAASSDIYRPAAMKYMLEATKHNPAVQQHEKGFIYRDMDLTPGTEKLPDHFPGSLKINSYSLVPESEQKILFDDRIEKGLKPIAGTIANDLFAVSIDSIDFLTSWLSLMTEKLEKLNDIHWFNNEPFYFKQVILDLTGPGLLKEVLKKLNMIHSFNNTDITGDQGDVWLFLGKCGMSVSMINKIISIYAPLQLKSENYFNPNYFHTSVTDGSWFNRANNGFVYQTYHDTYQLFNDLVNKINFELTYVNKLFTNIHFEYIAQHYAHLFESSKEANQFVANLFYELRQNHPDKITLLTNCEKQALISFNEKLSQSSPSFKLDKHRVGEACGFRKVTFDHNVCGHSQILNRNHSLFNRCAVMPDSQPMPNTSSTTLNLVSDIAGATGAMLNLTYVAYPLVNYFFSNWYKKLSWNKESNLTPEQQNLILEMYDELKKIDKNLGNTIDEYMFTKILWVKEALDKVNQSKMVSPNTWDNILFKMQLINDRAKQLLTHRTP